MTDEKPLLPITIIGGYLGSGKTTLVNNLLRQAGGKRLAILVNEFGALPIDEDLIEAQGDQMMSLAGGCVCCSYGSDLIGAMVDMAGMEPRPDHVVLEASGVALPAGIVGSLSLLSGFIIDGVVVLADGETVEKRGRDKYMGDTVLRQLEDADLVLMNKVDLLDDKQKEQARSWLAAKAGSAVIIETTNADVPPALVLQDFERGDERAISNKASNTPHGSVPLKTEQLTMEGQYNLEGFAKDLIANTAGLVRAKGFAVDQNGAMKTLQLVGSRFQISDAPDGVKAGIVTIALK